jgi:hypothetical protein
VSDHEESSGLRSALRGVGGWGGARRGVAGGAGVWGCGGVGVGDDSSAEGTQLPLAVGGRSHSMSRERPVDSSGKAGPGAGGLSLLWMLSASHGSPAPPRRSLSVAGRRRPPTKRPTASNALSLAASNAEIAGRLSASHALASWYDRDPPTPAFFQHLCVATRGTPATPWRQCPRPLAGVDGVLCSDSASCKQAYAACT